MSFLPFLETLPAGRSPSFGTLPPAGCRCIVRLTSVQGGGDVDTAERGLHPRAHAGRSTLDGQDHGAGKADYGSRENDPVDGHCAGLAAQHVSYDPFHNLILSPKADRGRVLSQTRPHTIVGMSRAAYRPELGVTLVSSVLMFEVRPVAPVWIEL